MKSELLVESLSLVAYTVIAAVLTALGLITEYASIQHFGAGDADVAIWLGVLGLVMLYAGVYGIGYKKVLSQFV